MNSVWGESVKQAQFNSLQENIRTDVLVIGGGITGILCTYMLKNAGVDCVLVEADRICGGITKNTTAKITMQHGLIYNTLIKQFGMDKAQGYAEAQKKALEMYERLCKEFPCDYEQKDAYVYTLDNRAKIERESEALQRLGYKAFFSETPHLPLQTAGAVCLQNQAQFHPLKFLYGIAKNLPIYEKTKVKELLPNKAVTENGEILCKKIIVATHFPILNKHGGYFMKMYQHRSYVLALADAADVCGMYIDEAETGMSFRSYNGLLLLGGGSHRTGKQGGGWKPLEAFAKKVYPNAKMVSRWATQDCMTLDSIPYIGQYAKGTQDLYVATGFNKWGMSSAMVAAMILSDMVRGKNNPYADVFSPSRSIYYPQLLSNVLASFAGFMRPTVPRCPHLGCALQYNREEHSWDCPCHGSRFTEKGELIDNPATDDMK